MLLTMISTLNQRMTHQTVLLTPRQFAYLHNNTYTIHHPQTDVITHEELCCRLPAHLVAQQRNSLTPSQSRVFTTVEQHFTTKHSSVLHIYISGSGGCGKSYLINLIIAYLQHSHYLVLGTSPVLVAAPTGTSIHHPFLLNLQVIRKSGEHHFWIV